MANSLFDMVLGLVWSLGMVAPYIGAYLPNQMKWLFGSSFGKLPNGIKQPLLNVKLVFRILSFGSYQKEVKK
jgi:hypothetical protein